MEIATFGGGCFWSVERAFAAVAGVVDTRTGYMGGHVDDPSYDQVCGGETGHVEVVEVSFDPRIVSYARLLEVFWRCHDPTRWDHQGNDEGEQYRSVIFVGDGAQREAALDSMEIAAGAFEDPIVTEIRDARTLWIAEDEHQGVFR